MCLEMFCRPDVISWSLELALLFPQTSAKVIMQKNAYALKTPHVVALPFIYGVECIQFHPLLATLKNVFLTQ